MVALLVGGVCMSALAADVIPDAPNPPRLVVDYAGIFSPQQVAVMEDSLETFARKTSNRIAVVTMPDLKGLEPMEMAYGIGKKWGVGDKKHNAGVVVLVKPKTADSGGQVFIATGYGVEGVAVLLVAVLIGVGGGRHIDKSALFSLDNPQSVNGEHIVHCYAGICLDC